MAIKSQLKDGYESYLFTECKRKNERSKQTNKFVFNCFYFF